MVTGRLPGKVFISHSSDDKPFVRKLVKDLEAQNFATWLDKKDIRVGDHLPVKISAGLAEAAAVAVVVSPSSTRSSWLHYELQLAVERMVKGLRVLPLILEDADIPVEIRSLKCADFRKSCDTGLEDVIRALERVEAEQAAESRFYQRVRERLVPVFDARGFTEADNEAARNP